MYSGNCRTNLWYHLPFMAEYSIGLDLGGTNLRAGAIDKSGKLLAKVSGATNLGAGREVDDLVLLTLGTGIGGGIISGGKVLHGYLGMAAELGHLTVVPNGNPCGCGNQGCLEKHASALAIVTMARLLGLGENLTAAEVYDLAKQGN